MIKTLFLTLTLFLSSMAFSSPIKVLKVKGDVIFSGEEVSKGQIFQKRGSLKVGPKSFIKFRALKWKSDIVLGPNSQMNIIESKLKSKNDFKILKGAARWLSKSIEAVDKRILTKNAAFGVRGTEFFIKYNELLGESEIVVFQGVVHMQNPEDPTDQTLIKKNQWGGIGGRYGKEIGNVLSLPSNVMDHFDKLLKIKSPSQ